MALIPCPKCGQMISDQAVNCPKCGAILSDVASTDQRPAYTQVSAQSSQYVRPTVQDEPNTALNVLSFVFPVVGWILWGVYKAESPIKARSCSKWAWIGVAVSFILNFWLFV